MTEPQKQPAEVHDDELCADSHAEEPTARTETERCIEGVVYGPCTHELCGGVCVYAGECPCPCHAPEDARSYRAQVNAPVPCGVLLEIDRRIADGNHPRYRVPTKESRTQR